MKSLILSCSIAVLSLCASPAFARDDGAPDLRSLMSAEDYRAAGLDKLSDDEREALSAWFERYREDAVETVKREMPPPPPPPRADEPESKANADGEIVARVVPAFKGWSGSTVFKLDNGQVWQQRMRGKFRYSGGSSDVVVSKNMLGGWKLVHVESGRGVLVREVDD